MACQSNISTVEDNSELDYHEDACIVGEEFDILDTLDMEFKAWIVITRYPLPQNKVTFNLSFLGGIYPIFLLDNIY